MTVATEGWTSLAQPYHEGMPAAGPAGVATFTADARPITNGCAVRITRLEMAVHTGTHVDAAVHFVPDGRSIDQYPVERFTGPGVALDVAREGMIGLDAASLDDAVAAAGVEVRASDIVLLSLGYGRRFGDPGYREHPYLTVDAAGWLVDRGVSMVGLDVLTPDLPDPLRAEAFDWPVHQVLLGADVLVMENLSGALAGFTGRRLEVIAVPVCIRGADGAPVVPLVRPA